MAPIQTYVYSIKQARKNAFPQTSPWTESAIIFTIYLKKNEAFISRGALNLLNSPDDKKFQSHSAYIEFAGAAPNPAFLSLTFLARMHRIFYYSYGVGEPRRLSFNPRKEQQISLRVHFRDFDETRGTRRRKEANYIADHPRHAA